MPTIQPKKDWVLTSRALHKLLGWIEEGGGTRDQAYLEMRRRLEAYFDRKNCSTPEELADEVLNRVARRLEEEGAIESETPARYCYIVARFVFMEHLRGSQREQTLLNDIRQASYGSDLTASEPENQKEKMLDCLELCTSKLEQTNHNIILRYYIGKERAKIENRRALAQRLGITVNALSIRACRIRDKLEACVKECVGR